MGIFSKYEMTDDDLKDLIIETVVKIIQDSPEFFIHRTGKVINPNLPIEHYLSSIQSHFPELENWGIRNSHLCANDRLKITAINLNTIYFNQRLLKVLKETHPIVFSLQVLGAKYSIANIFIEKYLDEKPNDELEIILKKLSKFTNNGIDADLFETIDMAENEILRVTSNQEWSQLFNQIMSSYVGEMEIFIDSIIGRRTVEMFFELWIETLDKCLPNLSHNLGLSQRSTKEISKMLKSSFSKYKALSTKEKFKDLRGGAGSREGSIWKDNEKLIKFYKTVEDLPKIKDISIWEYAFKRLSEEDFDYKYIEYLQSKIAFKNVPEELFRKAIKTWRKYKDNFNKPKPEEKPFAFALEHSRRLLDYPELKYSTMKRYYGKGKKLSKYNNLIIENSK